jgi:hypothetical protein
VLICWWVGITLIGLQMRDEVVWLVDGSIN